MVAWHAPENVDFKTAFNVTVADQTAKQYRMYYYAAVAYQDYNIGKLMETMDQLDQSNDTLVVVFGDHGW
eukprot:SAG31_NODE_579_length_13948_cov_5.599105_11_plen_70_part_00